MSTELPETTTSERRFSPWLAIAIGVFVVALSGTLYLYFGQFDRLLDQVPVHWGVGDQPDQFVPKAKALPHLLISPGVMLLTLVLTWLLPWLSPKPWDVERFHGIFQYIMALMVMLFGYIQATLVLAAVGAPIPMPRSLIAGIFLFFALLGNVLGKVRRNFWVGIRTPWTLANEKVWNATHRLSAWLFLALGLLGFVTVLAGVNLLVVMVVFVAAILWPIIYSLVLYKRLERTGQLE
jgi:uncharacterized membrane protein